MKPAEYLSYLKSKNWVPKRALSKKLILSFMPTGIDSSVWQASEPEKYFQGRLRKLPGDIELLSSFGFGGPAARTHLALALESGVEEVIFIGTAAAQNSELKLGDLCLLEGSHHEFPGVRNTSYSTVFDPWEEGDPNCDVVEMEAQHIFAWCQERQIKCSGLVVISDILYEESWKAGFDQIKDSLGQAHRLAYGLLERA